MAKSALQRAHVKNKNDSHPDHFRRKAAALAVAACFSVNIALANPTNPAVVHGTATFQQAGSILNVTNSHNAIINWGSFSIGINELTRFIQPSALSAVLNRVVGQDPSAILGALQSNGRVFLINPNGILFGAGSQINVAGLVASTLNLSNADFLAGRMNFTDGIGAGSVVNQGLINAGGGPVYMVGNAVTNNGIITSPGGEVVLAAGNSVELVNPGTPNLRVEIVAPNNEVRNLGTIAADAGRIGIYAGLIKQGGVINADSAVAEGGRIMLKSVKSTVLEAGSMTSARGTTGGEIIALSGMTDGVTQVGGTLDASATMGNGGFVETSAARVKVDDGARVSTLGGAGAQAGKWLIDPNDYSIASYGGDISGATLSANLGGTNVEIQSALGGTAGTGNIFVDDTVSWNSAFGLTLLAVNTIVVNQPITNAGTGDIKMYAGWNGASTAIPVVTFEVGSVQLHAPVSTAGNMHLIAGDHVWQDSLGKVTANNLLLVGAHSGVNMDQADNTVNTVAGKGSNFLFKNSGNLTIGSVGGVDGITVDNSALGVGHENATIAVTVVGGSLTVAGPVRALAAGASSEGGPGGNATINLTSDSTLTVNGLIEARGGNGGSSGGSYAYGGHASITLQSNFDVNINNSVTAVGGNGIGGGSGGNASIYIDGGEGITIAGAVVARGGHALGTGSGDGADGGEGVVSIGYYSYNNAITITAAGSIAAYGGNGGNDYSNYAGYGGDGDINLYSNGPVQIAGPLIAVGGMGGKSLGSGYSGSSGYGGGAGDGRVYVSSGYGSVSVTNTGSISATGGTGGNAEGGEGYVSGGYGGYANIYLASSSSNPSDFLTIEGPVTATSGPGGLGASGPGSAGTAYVSMSAYGGGININNTTVSAVAPGGADGAEGSVYLNANSYYGGGMINTATSTVSALGSEDSYYGSNVYFNAYGDITLGLVSSTGSVNVSSSYGGIIDGNSGLNILAPLAFLNGYGGVGSIANPLETQVAALAVSAYGGEIGVINSGNLFLLQANIQNGNAAIGATGALMVEGGEGYGYGYGVAAENGNLALFANGNMDLRGEVYASGDLLLNAGGNLTVGGGSYYTDVWGENSLNAVAGGNLSVLADSYGGSSWLGSYGLTTIKTGGNVLVDRSTIYGYPDVVMNVGGVININGTAGYGGSIEAGSPTTIYLTFPMLESGGYSVNGVAGLVYDPATGTGFFADGSPAVLGQNLLVTYGGAPVSGLEIPTNTLIVAMNQSINPPDPGENKDAFEEERDRKKKETQSCR